MTARPRLVALLAHSVVCTLVVGAIAGPARGQSPREELGAPDPTATPVPEPPTEVEPIDPSSIPTPPEPTRSATDEVQYPLPTAAEAARLAQADDTTVRIPTRITTRLRALDANLRALAAQGGGNVVNAVLSLLTGGLSITLGLLREPNTDEISIYLYLYGGAAAARGVLDFVLTPNASSQAITYQHMPMTSAAAVRERLQYGERALAGLAEQSLIARVLDASLNMAAGAAIIPVLAAREFAFSDPLDYFVLIGAGVSIISGIITLASSSSAEQRWSAYRQLRERLARERAAERAGGAEADVEAEAEENEAALSRLLSHEEGPRLSWGVAPSPNGAFASVGLTF